MWPFGGRFFPGTNLQDLNLDWIVQRVRDLSRGIIAPFINSANFHWMVWDTDAETFVDSGVSAAGEGTGPQGEPGKSPVIGSNGNWYNWDTSAEEYVDTDVHAQGPAGPSGPAGPAGPSGPGYQPLAGKKIAFLGDSNMKNWVDGTPNPFSGAGVADSDFRSFAAGAARFATADTTNNLDAQFAALRAASFSPDIIVIWAGGNDITYYGKAVSGQANSNSWNYGLPALGNYAATTGTTTYESLRRLLYNIRANYPAAQIVGMLKNYHDVSIVPREMGNYVYGTLAMIYNAWQVPVYFLEGIDNIQREAASNRALYYSDDRHYTPAAYTRIGNGLTSFLAALPMVGHSVNPPTSLYAPKTNNTQDAAVAWAASYFGGYGGMFWKFPRTGYKLFYNNGTADVALDITLIGDSTIMCRYGGTVAYYDGESLGGFAPHKLAQNVEWLNPGNDASAQYDMLSLRDGVTNFRIGAIKATTIGMNDELGAMIALCSGVIFGGRQENGYYKGLMMLFGSSGTAPENIPAALHGNLIFINYAPPQKTWTYFNSNGDKWQYTYP